MSIATIQDILTIFLVSFLGTVIGMMAGHFIVGFIHYVKPTNTDNRDYDRTSAFIEATEALFNDREPVISPQIKEEIAIAPSQMEEFVAETSSSCVATLVHRAKSLDEKSYSTETIQFLEEILENSPEIEEDPSDFHLSPPQPPLEKYTIRQLKAIASLNQVRKYGNLRKAELIAVLSSLPTLEIPDNL